MNDNTLHIYKFFADYIYKKTGMVYPEKDFYRLDSRITKLQTEFNCDTIHELYEKCKKNITNEMEMFLIDVCTNNETYFFRDEKPFKALTEELVPEILKTQATLKIWSCASSTGQEPISILISLLEAGVKAHITIDASDISDQALEKAKSGIYTGLDVQRGLPIQLMVKYFDSVEDGKWKFKSEFLNKINYTKFNLFTGHYKLNDYDIVFCRNVLIYQNQENKQDILNNLCTVLKPHGVLIMGAGESLIGMQTDLVQKKIENGIVFHNNIAQKSIA